MLDFEQLDVYRIAREFNRCVEELARRRLRGQSDLADQLRRASASILANIAEGAGEYSVKEKARFYRMARRSATEAASLLHIISDRGELRDTDTRQPYELIQRTVAMLTALTRSVENRPRPRSP